MLLVLVASFAGIVFGSVWVVGIDRLVSFIAHFVTTIGYLVSFIAIVSRLLGCQCKFILIRDLVLIESF